MATFAIHLAVIELMRAAELPTILALWPRWMPLLYLKILGNLLGPVLRETTLSSVPAA